MTAEGTRAAPVAWLALRGVYLVIGLMSGLVILQLSVLRRDLGLDYLALTLILFIWVLGPPLVRQCYAVVAVRLSSRPAVVLGLSCSMALLVVLGSATTMTGVVVAMSGLAVTTGVLAQAAGVQLVAIAEDPADPRADPASGPIFLGIALTGLWCFTVEAGELSRFVMMAAGALGGVLVTVVIAPYLRPRIAAVDVVPSAAAETPLRLSRLQRRTLLRMGLVAGPSLMGASTIFAYWSAVYADQVTRLPDALVPLPFVAYAVASFFGGWGKTRSARWPVVLGTLLVATGITGLLRFPDPPLAIAAVAIICGLGAGLVERHAIECGRRLDAPLSLVGPALNGYILTFILGGVVFFGLIANVFGPRNAHVTLAIFTLATAVFAGSIWPTIASPHDDSPSPGLRSSGEAEILGTGPAADEDASLPPGDPHRWRREELA